jgi:glycine/D-amino acid oxidase-like deaminating enzyme
LKFCDLPLKTTIGQSLLCKWPNKLPYSLLGEGHITPTEDPHFCQVGSTYEHTSQPTPQKALDLLKKVALFYPPAIDFEIVEVRAGVRIAPKVGYLPLIQKISAKTWVFTGLGSRGLLYHALLAKDLVDQISSSC